MVGAATLIDVANAVASLDREIYGGMVSTEELDGKRVFIEADTEGRSPPVVKGYA
jgi:hypothetical protein